MTRSSRYTNEELARLGDEIYERDIAPKMGPEDQWKVVVIEVESGDYEIDKDEDRGTRRSVSEDRCDCRHGLLGDSFSASGSDRQSRASPYGMMLGTLADGRERFFPVCTAIISWLGKPRLINVNVVEESAPLLGMGMLHGCELAMQVVEGGEVAIHNLG